MNPHECGYYGDAQHTCTCTPPLIQRYLSRISGPLLDRIDLHNNVRAVKYRELSQDDKAEESSLIRARILGEPVGLPAGYQGSSEVGHLNMGAGRIVVQELKRIDDGRPAARRGCRPANPISKNATDSRATRFCQSIRGNPRNPWRD